MLACNGLDTGANLPGSKESKRPVGVPLREIWKNYIKRGKQMTAAIWQAGALLAERHCSCQSVS